MKVGRIGLRCFHMFRDTASEARVMCMLRTVTLGNALTGVARKRIKVHPCQATYFAVVRR